MAVVQRSASVNAGRFDDLASSADDVGRIATTSGGGNGGGGNGGGGSNPLVAAAVPIGASGGGGSSPGGGGRHHNDDDDGVCSFFRPILILLIDFSHSLSRMVNQQQVYCLFVETTVLSLNNHIRCRWLSKLAFDAKIDQVRSDSF